VSVPYTTACRGKKKVIAAVSQDAIEHSTFHYQIITFDACHIRNDFKGVILGACTIDGNGQLVPLAFGTAPIEDNENWTKFVDSLNNPDRPVLIVRNRGKGIHNLAIEALQHCQINDGYFKDKNAKITLSQGP
jgi:hypothetical protein